jgi:hypothetical protein
VSERQPSNAMTASEAVSKLQRSLNNTDPVATPDITISRGGVGNIVRVIESLQWTIAEVKKEVGAIKPDWARVMRLMDQADWPVSAPEPCALPGDVREFLNKVRSVEGIGLSMRYEARNLQERYSTAPPEALPFKVGDQVKLRGGYDVREVLEIYTSYRVSAKNDKGYINLPADKLCSVPTKEPARKITQAERDYFFNPDGDGDPRDD